MGKVKERVIPLLSPEKILSIIEEQEQVLNEYGVKKIGLFGSHVRLEQTNNSDVDILVEFEQGKKTFDNYMDLKYYLEDLFDRKVDLVTVEGVKPELAPSILGSVKYAEHSSLTQ